MLYTIFSILCTLHYILCTPCSTLYSTYLVLYTTYSALPTLHYILQTLYSTLHTLHSLLYTIFSILCTLHYILCTPYSTLYSPDFVLYTTYSAHHTHYFLKICTLWFSVLSYSALRTRHLHSVVYCIRTESLESMYFLVIVFILYSTLICA